jgi:mRNA-degrading endonuclease HigB of HigAB toxin-antitoxin module
LFQLVADEQSINFGTLVGGNKVRLIAAIHYNRRKVYVRAVLTHAEYDEGRWKE